MRVKVVFRRELLADEIVKEIEQTEEELEDYCCWLDLSSVPRHEPRLSFFTDLWSYVDSNYAHLFKEDAQEQFTFVLDGFRLDPFGYENILKEGDVLHVQRAMQFEHLLLHQGLLVLDAEKSMKGLNKLSTIPVLEQVPAKESQGTKSSRSARRKAMKRRLKRNGSLETGPLQLEFPSAGQVNGHNEENIAEAAKTPQPNVAAVANDDNTVKAVEANETVKTVKNRKRSVDNSHQIEDYSKYPKVNSLPKEGDRIAYTILEIGEDRTPTISKYRKGIVESIDESESIVVAPVDAIAGKDQLGEMYDEDGKLELHMSMFNDVRLINEKVDELHENTFEFFTPSTQSTRFKSPIAYMKYQLTGKEERTQTPAGVNGKEDVSKQKSKPTKRKAQGPAKKQKAVGVMNKSEKKRCMQFSVGSVLKQIN